eukprot:1136203-Pelagomonas_calceolata.AAC.8
MTPPPHAIHTQYFRVPPLGVPPWRSAVHSPVLRLQASGRGLQWVGVWLSLGAEVQGAGSGAWLGGGVGAG